MHFKINFTAWQWFLLILPILQCVACVSNLPTRSNAGYFVDEASEEVSSWKELKEQNVIMQHYDYSCGVASMATLMKYYFNDDTTEAELINHIRSMFSEEEYARIENNGLSFLEMEIISRSRGYQSASVRLEVPALLELSGPVIVYLNGKSYRHFAVLRGIREDRVYMADPSSGNVRLSIDEFLRYWKGETFIMGKIGYGTPVHHDLKLPDSGKFRNEMELLRKSQLQKPLIRLMKLL
jgi:predicted double-glycine peptidase